MAIKEEYQRRGYGKRMLDEICRAALFYGCNAISVGSAGGYVEKFYIASGFIPVCYKAYNDCGIRIEKEFNNMQDYYSYIRKNENGFMVMKKLLNNN